MDNPTLQDVFTDIYTRNVWASSETVSGGGSEMDRTKEIRELIPTIVEEFGFTRILDAGCGDMHWFPLVEIMRRGCSYDGCDIVADMVKKNTQVLTKMSLPKHAKAHVFQANLVTDAFHAYDMIICRTVLFHLRFENIALAIENFRRSGSSFLMMTTHPKMLYNTDIQDGQWRRVNFQIEPFNLPEPIGLWPDGPGDDGYIGLWSMKR